MIGFRRELARQVRLFWRDLQVALTTHDLIAALHGRQEKVLFSQSIAGPSAWTFTR
jgi:hypothetical protein